MLVSFRRILPCFSRKPASLRCSVFRLSLPVLLSSLFQRLVAIVDIFLTGGLGAAAIAATGLGQLQVIVIMTVFWGLSTGATVVIAHLTGAKRLHEARNAAMTAIMGCIAMTAVISVLGVVSGGTLAGLMGASEEVQLLNGQYTRLVFLWLIWTTGVNVLSAIMHGFGDTRTPMVGIIIVNILHVLFAWPLIYGGFGIDARGVEGAAIAINLSESIGCFYLLIQAVRKEYVAFVWPDMRILKRVWTIGWPVGLERIAQQSGQLAYSGLIVAYGTTAYAAHQVGLSIESLSFMPGVGMGIAAATLMGQSLGAKKWERARHSHNEAMRVALVVMGLMAILFLAIPSQLVGLFTQDRDVIELGSVFLRLVAFAQIPLALSFVYAGSLRGQGDTVYVFVVTLVTMWGVRVFLAWIVGLVLHGSLTIVWGTFLVDWYVRALLFGWRYHTKNKGASVLS